ERLDIARETYEAERDAGQGRVSAGLAALRAATAKDRDRDRNPDDFRDRLARVVGRSRDQDDTPKPEGRNYTRERLKEIMEKDAGRDGQAAVHKLDGHSDPELDKEAGRKTHRPSVNERLKDVLNKPREKLEIEDEREQEKEQEVEKDRDIDRDPGLSH
ncbi:MAG: molybdopterin-guanine dinucleotide biosynthesis protein MobA, partial [Pseudomonadota bacterium]